MAVKKLPIGIDSFEKLIENDFYYVDKTMLIAELLNNWSEVNLFTRPRRFGKSLNMSMFKSFFGVDTDKSVFDGLKIMDCKKLCDEYMGKFPVISITLKGVEGATFESACVAFKSVIGSEARRFTFLLDSDKLDTYEKNNYKALLEMTGGVFTMDEDTLIDSLKMLCGLLYKHYGRKAVLLIDEYDVPLDKAFQYGYYDDMVLLIRKMFGGALKTNDSLQFSVLTGCLKISKESIFTGLNNLKVHNITDVGYDDFFGFVESEVKDMLSYYGLEEYADTVQEWYNGYKFGNTAVYCPWDVINYCSDAKNGGLLFPKNYWANTSGNAMIRRFINMADQETRDEIEELVNGNSIIKKINQELTYNELDSSIDNLWSVLFTTGYLTAHGMKEEGRLELVIPNKEIRSLFVNQIQEWFKETATSDTEQIERFCNAFADGDAEVIEELLSDYLWSCISIRDTAVRNERKENFYHGMLLGLLRYKVKWGIKSNMESGNGYSDILLKTPKRLGIVIEIKYAQDGDLDKACQAALEQIENKQYDAALKDDGIREIIKYGIAFYKKNCKVVKGQ
jgi:uncharacterized protein YecA (UPF0149 family)